MDESPSQSASHQPQQEETSSLSRSTTLTSHPSKQSLPLLKMNSVVSLPGGGEAVLKFIGQVENKNGVFAGVELLGESTALGKNSGEFNGRYYFYTSKPKTGLFLPYNKLIKTNKSQVIIKSPSEKSSPPNNRKSSQYSPNSIYSISSQYAQSTPQLVHHNVHNSHKVRHSSSSMSLRNTNGTPLQHPQPQPSHSPSSISHYSTFSANNSISRVGSVIYSNPSSTSTTNIDTTILSRSNTATVLGPNRVGSPTDSLITTPLKSPHSTPSHSNSPLCSTIKKQRIDSLHSQSDDYTFSGSGYSVNAYASGVPNVIPGYLNAHNSVNSISSIQSLSSLGNAGNIDEIEKLRMREKELLNTLNAYESQLKDRSGILDELKNTATELNAILSDKEQEITNYEQRFQKYKLNTDLQVKELLDNIGFLEKQSDENEKLYLSKLNQLELKVRALEKNKGSVGGDDDDTDDKVVELKSKVKQLEKELHVKDKQVRESLDNTVFLQRQSVQLEKSYLEKMSDLENKVRELRSQPKSAVTNGLATLEFEMKISKLEDQLNKKDVKIKELLTNGVSLQQQKVEIEKSYIVKMAELEEMVNTDFDKRMSVISSTAPPKDEMYIKMKEMEIQLKLKNQHIEELSRSNQSIEKQRDDDEKLYIAKLTELEHKVQMLEDRPPIIEHRDAEKVAQLESKVSELKTQLESKNKEFNDFKVEKNKEITDMRKYEMACYTKDIEIEKLNGKIADFEKLEQDNEKDQNVLVQELREKVKEVECQFRDCDFKLTQKTDQVEDKDKRIRILTSQVLDKQTNTTRLEGQITKLSGQVIDLTSKLTALEAKSAHKKRSGSNSSGSSGSPRPGSDKENALPKLPGLVNKRGELKIYEPPKKTDPTAGRSNFCGLCERYGHQSTECPYEGDMF